MNFQEMLLGRRTYRRYTQEEIPAEAVRDILNAARLSPSAANRQPLSYIVIQSKEKREEVFPLVKFAGALSREDGEPKEGEKPTLYIALTAQKEESVWLSTDAGIVMCDMTLAAWEHGIGSCMMGAIQKEPLRKVLELSPEQELHYIVAFGYPSHKSTVTDLEANGKVSYYLDENRDYHVPKRKTEDVTRYI